jgi:RNA polymerase primary sigma factor
MEVQEFQSKLEELCTIAAANQNVIQAAQVRDCLGDLELEQSQMLKILRYLKVKGISIEGIPEIPGEETDTGDAAKEQVPLTPEEEAYLQTYREELYDSGISPEELDIWFQKLAEGDADAHSRLTQFYLSRVADLAVEMNCQEIFLADLIQEASVSLLMALEQQEPKVKNDDWLCGEIRKGIRQAIQEQTDQKLHDDSLVARVEKLDSAVRDLNDDEEEENKFTIGELSIILDMSEDEIRDVLRLTGDDPKE